MDILGSLSSAFRLKHGDPARLLDWCDNARSGQAPSLDLLKHHISLDAPRDTGQSGFQTF